MNHRCGSPGCSFVELCPGRRSQRCRRHGADDRAPRLRGGAIRHAVAAARRASRPLGDRSAIAMCVVIHLRAPTRTVRRAGLFVACILILLGPVVWIGVFEGGYNHVLKNVFYFAGLSPDTIERLFPPPRYEVPKDWLFELTGVLQFPLGLIAARHTLDWWRNRESSGSQ